MLRRLQKNWAVIEKEAARRQSKSAKQVMGLWEKRLEVGDGEAWDSLLEVGEGSEKTGNAAPPRKASVHQAASLKFRKEMKLRAKKHYTEQRQHSDSDQSDEDDVESTPKRKRSSIIGGGLMMTMPENDEGASSESEEGNSTNSPDSRKSDHPPTSPNQDDDPVKAVDGLASTCVATSVLRGKPKEIRQLSEENLPWTSFSGFDNINKSSSEVVAHSLLRAAAAAGKASHPGKRTTIAFT